MSEILSSIRVKKTQRPHKCFWCGQMIPVGSSTIKNSGIGDDFWSDHWHLECNVAMNNCKDYDDEGGFWPYERGRGRIDDEKHLPPQFGEYGQEFFYPNLSEEN